LKNLVKKSIKNLLKKLNHRKEKITISLEKELNEKKIKEKEEELDIICLQIKKGEKLLNNMKE